MRPSNLTKFTTISNYNGVSFPPFVLENVSKINQFEQLETNTVI